MVSTIRTATGLAVTLALLFSVSATPTARVDYIRPEPSYCVNLGSRKDVAPYKEEDIVSFIPKDLGKFDAGTKEVKGTDFDEAYSTNRWNHQFAMHLQVADPKKKYDVVLGYAEVYRKSCRKGRRVFDVTVGDETTSNVDVFDKVGCDTVFEQTFYSVKPTGPLGVISVSLVGRTGNAMISTICIEHPKHPRTRPPTTTTTTTTRPETTTTTRPRISTTSVSTSTTPPTTTTTRPETTTTTRPETTTTTRPETTTTTRPDISTTSVSTSTTPPTTTTTRPETTTTTRPETTTTTRPETTTTTRPETTTTTRPDISTTSVSTSTTPPTTTTTRPETTTTTRPETTTTTRPETTTTTRPETTTTTRPETTTTTRPDISTTSVSTSTTTPTTTTTTTPPATTPYYTKPYYTTPYQTTTTMHMIPLEHSECQETGCFNWEGQGDYVVIGNSMSEHEARDNCAVRDYSTADLSLPIGGTVKSAHLYWSASGSIQKTAVATLNGYSVSASEQWSGGSSGYHFYGAIADVTSLISAGGSYTVSDLWYDASEQLCTGNAVYAAWTLVVIYEDKALPAAHISFCYSDFIFTYPEYKYKTFVGCVRGPYTSFARTTVVTFESDAYKGERFYLGGEYLGDNLFAGTTAPNLDIVEFDATHQVRAAQDTIAYTIESYRTNTIYGEAVEGLFMPIRVLYYTLH